MNQYMTAKRKPLLTQLLRVLVEEWGYDNVKEALAHLPHEALVASEVGDPLTRASRRERNRSKRPNALDAIRKLQTPDDRRDALLAIAAKFDERRFLPSVGDIRQFLSMMGREPIAMKDRSDGVRSLIAVLVELPLERLEHLASSSSYSGPAQLGPLSDAIRIAGATLRRDEAALETPSGETTIDTNAVKTSGEQG